MSLACRSFSVRQLLSGLPYRLPCCFARLTRAQASRVGATLEGTVRDTSSAIMQLESYAAQPFDQSISTVTT